MEEALSLLYYPGKRGQEQRRAVQRGQVGARGRERIKSKGEERRGKKGRVEKGSREERRAEERRGGKRRGE